MSSQYKHHQSAVNSRKITPTSSPATPSFSLTLSAEEDENRSEAYYSDTKTGSAIHGIMAEEIENIMKESPARSKTMEGIDADYSYYLEDENKEKEEEYEDATTSVKETHYALLYLLSNPDEFQEVLSQNQGLKEWNEHESALSGTDIPTPLPFAVFAPDAEVVLPQAHTASQLFGIETIQGIELEAAAGMLALSQLFLRWLALMPGGDHCNIIDPPGLTVMRIAGGRYRVTGAHRVVWTWMNDFHPEAVPSYYSSPYDKNHDLRFSFGDLVTMTIIDVFETDKDGKLLSYCPTFDNRSITKTNITRERISKESHNVKEILGAVSKSRAAYQVNKAACYLGQVGLNVARGVGGKVYGAWSKDVEKSDDPVESSDPAEPSNHFVIHDSFPEEEKELPKRSEHYVSDDETTQSAGTR